MGFFDFLKDALSLDSFYTETVDSGLTQPVGADASTNPGFLSGDTRPMGAVAQPGPAAADPSQAMADTIRATSGSSGPPFTGNGLRDAAFADQLTAPFPTMKDPNFNPGIFDPTIPMGAIRPAQPDDITRPGMSVVDQPLVGLPSLEAAPVTPDVTKRVHIEFPPEHVPPAARALVDKIGPAHRVRSGL